MSPLFPLPRRHAALACVALAASLLFAGLVAPLSASEPADPAPPPTTERRQHRWSEEALELAEGWPVQAGGRVKPLLTFASYNLLAFNGRRSVKVIEGGEERWIGPTEWFLDVLFFPRDAATYHAFLVQDDATLDAIGFTRELREAAAKADYEREGGGEERRKKRDRWSFTNLLPHIRGLEVRASEYRKQAKLAPRSLDRIQNQVLGLADNVARYGQLMTSLILAGRRLPLPQNVQVERILGPGLNANFTQVLAKLDELRRLMPEAWIPGEEHPGLTAEQTQVATLVEDLIELAGSGDGLAFLPPSAAGQGGRPGAWMSPHDALALAWDEGRVPPETLALLQGFEHLGYALGTGESGMKELRTVSADLSRASAGRRDASKVGLELTYQRLDPIGRGWILYFVGLSFALLGLLSLGGGRVGRVLRLLAWILTVGATVVLIGAIVMRCIIRERPPVTTLYETILFITATGAVVCFALGALSRRWLALPLAGAVGTLGLRLADWFEEISKQDMMPTLEAVLDTNFWLSTHVTCVTFGYSAGLLAAIIGMVYVMGRVLGIGKQAHEAYAAMGRTVYGVIGFGLLLSLVGTILGGIWANDSWGRFWGWDPKENGALMIVLWELVMLHARMAGYVGPFGFSMLAVFGGAVVTWSWWGVNLLGVGLHSYGFTEGIWTMVLIVWATLGGVLLLGGTWWFVKGPGRAPRA